MQNEKLTQKNNIEVKFDTIWIKTLVLVLFSGLLAYYLWSKFESPIVETSESTILQSPPEQNHICEIQDSLHQAKSCTFLIGGGEDIGHGTGFLINDQGYAVTNLHVLSISPNGQVPITINGIESIARVVGYSSSDDIAVVRIYTGYQANCLWADSDSINLAEEVYAIGWPNSFEGESTITKGIISRKVRSSTNSVEMFQTDTPINPGNSGGPLINKCGVVGINSSKNLWVNDAPSEGIGFSITSNYARKIVEKIIQEDDGSYKKIDLIPENITVTKNNSGLNTRDFDYYSNQKVAYDYDKVKYWETRREEDKRIKKSWSELLGNEYVDQKDLSKLLSQLDNQIEISNVLWDGFTNSKITYGEASDLEKQYTEENNTSVTLSLKLTKKIKDTTYERCINQWEEYQEETGKEFSNEIDECSEILD